MPSIRDREARESTPLEQTFQGEERRRRGKKGRAVVYVSDFMPPPPSSPSVVPRRSQNCPRQGKEDEKLLRASGSGRAEVPNRERKGRRAQLVSGALTAFPPGACLKKPTEASSRTWQLHRKGKRRNPDTPFNHRAQFSKLKRTIYEVRKAVFESFGKSQDGVSSCGNCVNMERNSTERETLVEDASATSVDASASFSSKQRQLLRMRCLVTDMERVYGQIHKTMRQKHYARARQHMNQIRQLKKHLNTAALKWRLSTAAEVEADAAIHIPRPLPHAVDLSGRVATFSAAFNDLQHDEDVDGAAELTDEPNYVNFYPSLAQMGVGCHPLAEWIDRRSQKYPRRLGKEELPRLIEGRYENDEEKRVVSTGPAVPSPVKYVAMCCTNIITDALDNLVFTILQQQYHLQRRMKKEKPLQFKARRFYSTGLRETLRGLRAAATRIPVVLIASDIEVHASWNSEGCYDERRVAEADSHEVRCGKKKTVQEMGMDGTLEEIRAHCESHGIPLITCMSRHRLAYALFAKGCTVSAVLLHSAEGVHEEVRALRHYAQHLFEAFAALSATHQNIPHAS